MKTKKIFIQTIAMTLCVITLSLSVGSKFCFYDNISKAHAADPFTITMGSLALEEIILGIATAILGYEVVEQYHDDIIDSFKEYAKDPSMITDPQKNLFEAYAGTSYSSYSWEEYQEILQGMGSASKEKLEDYKDKFSNVFVRPCKEYLQYVADFYTDLFTGSPVVGDATYIEGLAEYLKQEYFDSSIIDKMLSGETYELKVTGVYSFSKCSTCGQSGLMIRTFSPEAKGLHCLSFLFENDSGVYYSHWYYDNGMKTDLTTYNHVTCHDATTTSSNWTFGAKSVYSNIPVFRDSDVRKNFLNTGEGYENALNYLRQYRLADWLQDDWSGELFDPLTGLSYLNDLANMAKHQGLNAIGNDPSLDDMKQHLRDIIANLKPGYDPVTDPSVDPALDPICYPDTIPTPVIDPTADVVLQPAKDPTPSPNPDPSPSTSPKPTTQPTPSPGEIDSSQPVVDLSKFFPFCIPFDLIHLVQALDADPVAPKWTLKLEPPQFPVEWEVTIDLSQFESLAKIFRTGETLLFVVGLILITRGIIKG